MDQQLGMPKERAIIVSMVIYGAMNMWLINIIMRYRTMLPWIYIVLNAVFLSKRRSYLAKIVSGT